MKKSLLIFTVFLLALTSCENFLNNVGDEYLFKTSNGLKYKYTDFALYDSSTHILYLKTNHPEFKDEKSSNFSILADGDEIYKGVFWPSFSSSLPYGPYISSYLTFYPDYTIVIGFISIDNEPKDPRNDPRIIASLKDHNLLHSGLSLTINSVDVGLSALTFKFTLTNKDETDLLILDPEKTGLNLFHYFTNGLSIRKLTYEEVFSSQIVPEIPSDRSTLNTTWLSELKAGASRQFTINYTLKNPLNPGEYNAVFEFPGLNNLVTIDQLFQDNKRIWLGDVQTTKKIIIK